MMRQRIAVLFVAMLVGGTGVIGCGVDDPVANQSPTGDNETDPDAGYQDADDEDVNPNDPDAEEPDAEEPDATEPDADPDGGGDDFTFENAPGAGDMIVSEFMKSPTEVLPESGQWIEFYNTSDNDYDLQGCEISSSVVDNVVIDISLSVAAGALVTIANSDTVGFDADHTIDEMRFAEGAGSLGLECDTEEIDALTYDGGEFFPSTAGASVARDAENFAGDSNTSWFWCAGTGAYNGSDLGSPGTVNEACPWLNADSSQVIADLKTAVANEEVIEATTLENVLVTYVKEEVGSDEGGFFLQATADGPAIFVPVDGVSSVSAGQLISLEVLNAETLADSFPYYGATFITEFDALEILRVYLPPSLLTTEVTDAADLVTALDAYEHRLISSEVAVQSFGAFAGTGHSKFMITTEGLGEEIVELRFPFALSDGFTSDLGIVQECVVSITDTPMWRNRAMPQLSVWNAEELEVVSCNAVLLSAMAVDAEMVELQFSRDLEEGNGNGDDFTIAGLEITFAVFDGSEVLIQTSAQTSGTTYTVEVEDTLVDAWGETATGTADFMGYFPQPTAAGEVVITEFMARFQGGGQDPGEYVELKNITDDTFGLGGCILNDGGASGASTIPGEVVLEPGDSALFTSSAGGAADLVEDGVVSFLLTNTGDTITLTCDGTVIDTLSFTGSQVELGISYQKDVDALEDSNDDMNTGWCLTPQVPDNLYWTGDADDVDAEKFGTPGTANVSCQ